MCACRTVKARHVAYTTLCGAHRHIHKQICKLSSISLINRKKERRKERERGREGRRENTETSRSLTRRVYARPEIHSDSTAPDCQFCPTIKAMGYVERRRSQLDLHHSINAHKIQNSSIDPAICSTLLASHLLAWCISCALALSTFSIHAATSLARALLGAGSSYLSEQEKKKKRKARDDCEDYMKTRDWTREGGEKQLIWERIGEGY